VAIHCLATGNLVDGTFVQKREKISNPNPHNLLKRKLSKLVRIYLSNFIIITMSNQGNMNKVSVCYTRIASEALANANSSAITVLSDADLRTEAMGGLTTAAQLREFQTAMAGVSLTNLASHGFYRGAIEAPAPRGPTAPITREQLQGTLQFVLDLVSDEELDF
jgi:hypothetical protein